MPDVDAGLGLEQFGGRDARPSRCRSSRNSSRRAFSLRQCDQFARPIVTCNVCAPPAHAGSRRRPRPARNPSRRHTGSSSAGSGWWRGSGWCRGRACGRRVRRARPRRCRSMPDAAAAIVDRDRLAEIGRRLFGVKPRHGIDRSAGRVGHDDGDGPVGKALRMAAPAARSPVRLQIQAIRPRRSGGSASRFSQYFLSFVKCRHILAVRFRQEKRGATSPSFRFMGASAFVACPDGQGALPTCARHDCGDTEHDMAFLAGLARAHQAVCHHRGDGQGARAETGGPRRDRAWRRASRISTRPTTSSRRRSRRSKAGAPRNTPRSTASRN